MRGASSILFGLSSLPRPLLAALAPVLLAGPALAQMSPPVPPANLPANCTAAEFRQFDFWIGKWRVFKTDKPDEMVGGSEIESVYNGCGLRENWQPFTMASGGSLSGYDRKTRKWRQAWIDSFGVRADFEGGMLDGSMVMLSVTDPAAGAEAASKRTRMTWSPLAGGAVRQLGEASADGGKTWQRTFDFTYRPAR